MAALKFPLIVDLPNTPKEDSRPLALPKTPMALEPPKASESNPIPEFPEKFSWIFAAVGLMLPGSYPTITPSSGTVLP